MSVVVPGAMLVLWELCSRLAIISPRYFPAPTTVGWVLLLVVLQVATQVLLRRPRHRALVFG